MAPGHDTVLDLPDLTGKVAIVTGPTSGVGLATAAALVRKGAKVYFAARNEAKAKACIRRIKEEGLGPGNGQAVFFHLDLADPRKAKRSAEEFLKKEDRLDILVNNAGMIVNEPRIAFDGVHEVMVTNYFSPFVFTRKLLPLLKKTETNFNADVRIVILSSDSFNRVPDTVRFKTKKDFNVMLESGPAASFRRYGASKLADLLWARELQRRLEAEGSNIIVTAVNPGLNMTENATREFKNLPPGVFQMLQNRIAPQSFKPPTHGAGTVTFAAAGNQVRTEAAKYKGAYVKPEGIGRTSKAGEDKELAKELWNTTEMLVNEWGLQ